MRLATFNILHGRAPSDGRVDLDRFAGAVRALDADVLALQEVDRDQPRSSGRDLTAVAAEAMGAVSHRFVATLAGTPGAAWVAATGYERPGAPAYGIALLSRFPASAWRILRMPPLPLRVPVQLPDPRRLALVREEPRVAVAARISGPELELTVVNTHLSFLPGWNRVQLRRLTRDLVGLPDPLVLLGDLNLSGRRPAAVTGYTSLAAAPTFPADRPAVQLDHVLVRRDALSASAVRTVQAGLSDHRALVVEVRERVT